MPSDVKFLYFSQSYISKLFDGESQSKLEFFLKRGFHIIVILQTELQIYRHKGKNLLLEKWLKILI